MRVRCPSCGAENSLESLIADEDARKALEIALSTSPLGKALLGYLSLFRPRQQRLTWDRVRTLLEEIMPHIEKAQCPWEGKLYAAPKDAWIAAIGVLIEMRGQKKLETPLKNHNLLKAVIARRAVQATEAAQARAEAAQDARLRENPEAARSERYADSSSSVLPILQRIAAKENHLVGLRHLQKLKPSAATLDLIRQGEQELAEMKAQAAQGGAEP